MMRKQCSRKEIDNYMNYTHFVTVALYFKKIYDIMFLWHMPIKMR